MQDSDFIVTFPLYLLVNPSKGLAPLIVTADDDDSFRGVAMFTEELFAERTRDAQASGFEIWTVPTIEHLKSAHLPLFRNWGYKYVAIDTHERTGKGRFVPIENLED